MVRMVRMVRSLADRTFQLWLQLQERRVLVQRARDRLHAVVADGVAAEPQLL